MRFNRSEKLKRLLSALITFAGLAALSTVRAADEVRPSPQVVSAVPKDCKDLGEVSGKHADNSPSEEKAQAQAIREATKMGATHLVFDSVIRCTAYTMCYEATAYRCPADAPVSPAK